MQITTILFLLTKWVYYRLKVILHAICRHLIPRKTKYILFLFGGAGLHLYKKLVKRTLVKFFILIISLHFSCSNRVTIDVWLNLKTHWFILKRLSTVLYYVWDKNQVFFFQAIFADIVCYLTSFWNSEWPANSSTNCQLPWNCSRTNIRKQSYAARWKTCSSLVFERLGQEISSINLQIWARRVEKKRLKRTAKPNPKVSSFKWMFPCHSVFIHYCVVFAVRLSSFMESL